MTWGIPGGSMVKNQPANAVLISGLGRSPGEGNGHPLHYSCLENSMDPWWAIVGHHHSVRSESLWPHGLQHARLPYPSQTPGACSNSCSSSLWCHSTISSSAAPFSFCFQSFPESGSFPKSRVFASGGKSIGVSASASVLPMNIQGWFPLGFTGSIFLISKGVSRVFSNTAVQNHQFFSI